MIGVAAQGVSYFWYSLANNFITIFQVLVFCFSISAFSVASTANA
jgi:hypothetical protein